MLIIRDERDALSRYLTLSDLKQAAEIYQISFDEPWGEASLRSLLNTTGCFGIGYFEKTKTNHLMAGFILCRTLFDEAEIITFAVHPNYRGQAIGKKILSDTHKTVKSRNCTTIFLEVSEKNKTALNLYSKCGYKHISTRKNYYKTANGPVNAYVMQHNLT